MTYPVSVFCRSTLAVLVLASGLFGPWAAKARANDKVFVVARVPVSAQADSAIAAKQNAERDGRRQAMDILLRRLTPKEDWGYLPRLGRQQPAPKSEGFEAIENPYQDDPYKDGPLPGGQIPATQSLGGVAGNALPGKSAITLDDDALRRLEQSFEVYDEKSAPTTYRAFITYRFKPDETRNLLINASLPYSETQTRTALVLPVLQTDRGLYLWEQNNPWLRAWQMRPLSNELTPMTAPLGDLEDSAGLTARQALDLDQDRLAALADRYGVPQIIVAHARLSQSNGEDKVRVRLINGLRESGALAADETVYSAREAFDSVIEGARGRLADGAPSLADPSSAAGAGQGTQLGGRDTRAALREPGDVLAEAYVRELSGNFPALADRAIVASVAKYASSWKAQTLIDHSQATVLRATAFFRSLEEWKRIRLALISTPLVGSVQIRYLSREGAEMSIQSFGDPGKLVVALENQGISLWTFNNGPVEKAVWNLATPATAARVPARVQRAPFQQRQQFGQVDEPYGRQPQTAYPTNYDVDPVTGNPIFSPSPGAAPQPGDGRDTTYDGTNE
ncbi:MAG: DUF2066 domain-containing protein [Pseudomonadota bacterium]